MKRPVPAASLAVAALLALLVGGCGGGSSSSTAPSRSVRPSGPAGSKVVACRGDGAAHGLRATAVDCASARKVMSGWGHARTCSLAKGESRGACSVAGFRCQSVRTEEGVAVSCARPGEAVAFVKASD